MRTSTRALFLVIALLAGLAGSARAGELVAGQFKSAALSRELEYEVYLPPGYHDGIRRYPVIYLLHGVGDNDTTWKAKAAIDGMTDGMIARGMLAPCILVMPDAGRSWYVNGPEKMETAFINDLIPQIDRLYRTRPDRRWRMIAGISMGGFGAMRLALRYPDHFSAVALMSPAIYSPEPPPSSSARVAPAFQAGGNFDPERWRRMNYPALMDDFVKSGFRLRVQLSAGLQDRLETAAAAERFAANLRVRGFGSDMTLLPGGHDFDLWRQTLPLALQFLAGPARGTQTAAIPAR